MLLGSAMMRCGFCNHPRTLLGGGRLPRRLCFVGRWGLNGAVVRRLLKLNCQLPGVGGAGRAQKTA